MHKKRTDDFGLGADDLRQEKRGQIEMIGLVIVVIILSIGLLFYFKFAIMSDDNGKSGETTLDHAYVTNLMNSIFNVKTCNETPIKIEEAIVECFNGREVCGEDACTHVNNTIKGIRKEVGLKNYGNYSIWISKEDSNVTIINECKTGVLTYTTIKTPDRESYSAFFRVC